MLHSYQKPLKGSVGITGVGWINANKTISLMRKG